MHNSRTRPSIADIDTCLAFYLCSLPAEVAGWRKAGPLLAHMVIGQPAEGGLGLGPPQLLQQGSGAGPGSAAPSQPSPRPPNYLRLMGAGLHVPAAAKDAAFERMGRSTSSVILPGKPGTEMPSPPPGACVRALACKHALLPAGSEGTQPPCLHDGFSA